MEIRGYILLIIVGCAIVTFLPRVLPLVIFSQMKLPKWLIRWLKNVPVAVMAALLAQELLLSNNQFSISDNFLKLLAAVPAFIIAILTKSLLGTVMVGVVFMAILRFAF